MGKPSMIPAPQLDKWKIIQFAELDIFCDKDEELTSIGMTPSDIKQFREWQKIHTSLIPQKIGE